LGRTAVDVIVIGSIREATTITTSIIRLSTFPRTKLFRFVGNLMCVFRTRENDIAIEANHKGLKRNDVLTPLGPDLWISGFVSNRDQ
jgi:hypothetical protein